MPSSRIPNKSRFLEVATIYRDAMVPFIDDALGPDRVREQLFNDEARERNLQKYEEGMRSFQQGTPVRNLIDHADIPFLIRDNLPRFSGLDRADVNRMHKIRLLWNDKIKHLNDLGDFASEDAVEYATHCARVLRRCGLDADADAIIGTSSSEAIGSAYRSSKRPPQAAQGRESNKARLASKRPQKLTWWELQHRERERKEGERRVRGRGQIERQGREREEGRDQHEREQARQARVEREQAKITEIRDDPAKLRRWFEEYGDRRKLHASEYAALKQVEQTRRERERKEGERRVREQGQIERRKRERQEGRERQERARRKRERQEESERQERARRERERQEESERQERARRERERQEESERQERARRERERQEESERQEREREQASFHAFIAKCRLAARFLAVGGVAASFAGDFAGIHTSGGLLGSSIFPGIAMLATVLFVATLPSDYLLATAVVGMLGYLAAGAILPEPFEAALSDLGPDRDVGVRGALLTPALVSVAQSDALLHEHGTVTACCGGLLMGSLWSLVVFGRARTRLVFQSLTGAAKASISSLTTSALVGSFGYGVAHTAYVLLFLILVGIPFAIVDIFADISLEEDVTAGDAFNLSILLVTSGVVALSGMFIDLPSAARAVVQRRTRGMLTRSSLPAAAAVLVLPIVPAIVMFSLVAFPQPYFEHLMVPLIDWVYS